MTPEKAPTACMEPGCPNLTTAGGRCAPCRAEHLATGRSARDGYEQSRGSARDRGYGTKWEKRRRRHMELEPWCRRCGRGGRDVDHVIPHRGADWLFDLEGNLQTLCQSHHTRKTQQERKIPIGIMYPLNLPEPTRPISLICGPDVTHHKFDNELEVIDCNLGTHQVAGEELFRFEGLEQRNALLRWVLIGDADVRLWVVMPAPRTAERAYWSHVLQTDAQLVQPLSSDEPVDWWADYNLDQRAEEAMARRRAGGAG